MQLHFTCPLGNSYVARAMLRAENDANMWLFSHSRNQVDEAFSQEGYTRTHKKQNSGRHLTIVLLNFECQVTSAGTQKQSLQKTIQKMNRSLETEQWARNAHKSCFPEEIDRFPIDERWT